MKKTGFLCIGLLWGAGLMAQPITNKKGSQYQFTVVREIGNTSVKNQANSGTCWSFSTLSFFESELQRMGKGDYDLAEMFIVRMSYYDKAVKYVRLHGKINFGQGGAFHDPVNVIRKYGILPETAYPGNNYGEPQINHNEVEHVLKAYLDAVLQNKNGKLSTAWDEGINGILDAYFGKVPENFTYNGKTYTAKSFAESLGLKGDEYVDLTSYSHHPFYSSFILELEDNWAWDVVYNLPIDEWMRVLEHAVTNGYSVAWGADVSDKGFSHKNGLAIMPDKDLAGMPKPSLDSIFLVPQKEKTITQEMRQADFDNWTLTDDHGMQIVGLVKDQNGVKYYVVKNSWGTTNNECGGYFYASEAYVKARTMNFMVHKDALPSDIRTKLKL